MEETRPRSSTSSSVSVLGLPWVFPGNGHHTTTPGATGGAGFKGPIRGERAAERGVRAAEALAATQTITISHAKPTIN